MLGKFFIGAGGGLGCVCGHVFLIEGAVSLVEVVDYKSTVRYMLEPV